MKISLVAKFHLQVDRYSIPNKNITSKDDGSQNNYETLVSTSTSAVVLKKIQ